MARRGSIPFRSPAIVGSYLRHHQIAPDQIAGLIVEVHRTLASLGRATPRCGAEPAGNRAARDPTARSPAKARAAVAITPAIFHSLPGPYRLVYICDNVLYLIHETG